MYRFEYIAFTNGANYCLIADINSLITDTVTAAAPETHFREGGVGRKVMIFFFLFILSTDSRKDGFLFVGKLQARGRCSILPLLSRVCTVKPRLNAHFPDSRHFLISLRKYT